MDYNELELYAGHDCLDVIVCIQYVSITPRRVLAGVRLS